MPTTLWTSRLKRTTFWLDKKVESARQQNFSNTCTKWCINCRKETLLRISRPKLTSSRSCSKSYKWTTYPRIESLWSCLESFNMQLQYWTTNASYSRLILPMDCLAKKMKKRLKARIRLFRRLSKCPRPSLVNWREHLPHSREDIAYRWDQTGCKCILDTTWRIFRRQYLWRLN